MDFVGGLLHVRQNYTDRRVKVPKGKRVRSVPMVPDVVSALARQKERATQTSGSGESEVAAVPTARPTPTTTRSFSATKPASSSTPGRCGAGTTRPSRDAGLRRLVFHALRHAFGTAAITQLDPYAVQSTWATRTTPRRSATSTIARGLRTQRSSPRHFRDMAGTRRPRSTTRAKRKTPWMQGIRQRRRSESNEVRGFAGRCVATPPRRRGGERSVSLHPPGDGGCRGERQRASLRGFTDYWMGPSETFSV